MKCLYCLGILLAGLCAATWANMEWHRSNGSVSYAEGEKTINVDCGHIHGVAGCVLGWDLVQTGEEWIVTDADLGGQWAKDTVEGQYQQTSKSLAPVEDEHYHYYSYSTSTDHGYKTIRAQAIQVINKDGGCWKMDPASPGWWWIPTVLYTDRGIDIEVENPNDATWSEFNNGWTDNHYDQPASYSSSNPGQGPIPVGTGSNGEMRYSKTLPNVAAGTHIRIAFKWRVTAGANVDNAYVQQWEEVVTYTAMSALTTAASSQDFDLQDLLD